MEKHRRGGRVSGSLFAGGVAGASVVIYDDMISTGQMVARAAEAAVARGAMYCAAAHGLFSGDAVAVLNSVPLSSLAVADTVEGVADRCAALTCELAVIDCAALLAAALAGDDR